MAYKQIFSILPREIENYIYQFNPEHRELMKPVLKCIVKPVLRTTPKSSCEGFVICMHCYVPLNKYYYCRADQTEFCSLFCFKFFKIVNKYLDNKDNKVDYLIARKQIYLN